MSNLNGDELVALAERCEAATGPDRELDLRIAAAVLPDWAPLDEASVQFHVKYGGQLPYTASLDAAMTLTDGLGKVGGASGVLRDAISRLGKRFDLHMRFWPEDQPYAQWLARYVAAVVLRARAALSA